MKHTLYTTAILACMAAANMPAMVSASDNMAVEMAMAQENTQQHFLTDAAYRQKVEEDFQNTLLKCQEVTWDYYKKIPLHQKILGRIFRLVAPLM